eukprot:759745-Amphidinium_carterae.1
MSVLSLLLAALILPEYQQSDPKFPRSSSDTARTCSSCVKDMRKLLKTSDGLAGLLTASFLSSCGMSAFLALRTLWARQAFGWNCRRLGRMASLYGLTLVAA